MEGEVDGQPLAAEGVTTPLVPARCFVPGVSYFPPREHHPKAISIHASLAIQSNGAGSPDWGEADPRGEDRNGRQ
jgi:hypothetical protein